MKSAHEDWLQSNVSAASRAKSRDRALAAFRAEIRDRAALMMRLGHSRTDATRRVKQYLAWEFDPNGKPRVLAEVDALVEEVYKRR